MGNIVNPIRNYETHRDIITETEYNDQEIISTLHTKYGYCKLRKKIRHILVTICNINWKLRKLLIIELLLVQTNISSHIFFTKLSK